VVQRAHDGAGRAGDLICPQLPASPKAAMELALLLAERHAPHNLSIVGSSLGGFYATWLAERLGCRAVLLNPAVDPLKDLEKHVGVTTPGIRTKPFEFRANTSTSWPRWVARITRPERYFLIAATGDEVLDYRDMVAHYAGRAPACDRRQRPCDFGICAVCGRGAGVLRGRIGRRQAVRGQSLRLARWHRMSMAGRDCRHARLADHRGFADGAPGRAQRAFRVQRLHQKLALCLADEARRSACAPRPRVGARSAAALRRRAGGVRPHRGADVGDRADWPLVFGAGRTLARHHPVLRSAGARGPLEFARIRKAIRCWRVCAPGWAARPERTCFMRGAVSIAAIKDCCWSPRYSCRRCWTWRPATQQRTRNEQ
jgi:predicted esterase YcpF (UPF0227 family)